MTKIMLDDMAGEMLEWKECEHELNDQAVLGDQETMAALHNCGLLKLFMCLGMWAQPMLLERLVAMWDFDSQVFMVENQELTLEVEDIYFITKLSQRGVTAMFTGRGGGEESVDSYVREYYHRSAQNVSNKLPISQVVSLPLKTILFTVTRIAGSTTPHLASKVQMQYALIALDGVVCNWCMGLLVNMKD